MKKQIKLILIALTPIILILNNILKQYPRLVEKYYSNSLNRWTRQIQNFIASPFPFSIAEILYFSLIIGLLIFIVILCTKIKSGGVLNQLINILSYLSLLYVLFIFLWGFNYNRLSFDKIADLRIEKSTKDQLKGLCQELIIRANDIREKVDLSPKGIMVEPLGYKDVFNRAQKGYEKSKLIFPQLGGRYSKPKPIFLSQALCYTGITGMYMPYTGEANVNIRVQDFMLPCTTAHEMAHQRGFAREDEANYIAYITCSLNPDADFQYSGVMLALIHSMNALADKDINTYIELRKQYSEGVKKDLEADNDFWKKYNGKIKKLSGEVNNSYLKSNGQGDGTESYGRMVDLLLAQYKKGSL
ncbi:MAG: DUF3810 domain-containing protein [Clostridiaceae bacterium]|nr:DUF3810 domain-containing protein [Clostridiaceae bacterium]